MSEPRRPGPSQGQDAADDTARLRLKRSGKVRYRLPKIRVRTILGQIEDHRLTGGQFQTLVDLDAVMSSGPPAAVSMRGQGWVCSGPKVVGSKDAAVWLRLVGMGLVEGSRGEVRLTQAGSALVQSVLAKGIQ